MKDNLMIQNKYILIQKIADALVQDGFTGIDRGTTLIQFESPDAMLFINIHGDIILRMFSDGET